MIEPFSLSSADPKIQTLYLQITNPRVILFSEENISLADQISAFAEYLNLLEETQERSLENQCILLYCYALLAFYTGNFKAASSFAYWSMKCEKEQQNVYWSQALLYKKALVFFAQYEAKDIQQKVWVQERLKQCTQEVLTDHSEDNILWRTYNALLDLQFLSRMGLIKKLSKAVPRLIDGHNGVLNVNMLCELDEPNAPLLWKKIHICPLWERILQYLKTKSIQKE